jgi:predicted kinase
MTENPRIYILIGPPACGKSTWTESHLASTDRPTTVLSSDAFIEQWAKENGKTYSEAFGLLDLKEIEQKLDLALRDAARERKDIIVDRTNMRLRVRRRWLGQTPKNYVRVGVEFPIDQNVLFERLDSRAKATGKVIPHQVVLDMIENFQQPTYEEFDVIDRVVA